MDSPDIYEALTLVEIIFGTGLPENDENFASSGNLADWLEIRLLGLGAKC